MLFYGKRICGGILAAAILLCSCGSTENTKAQDITEETSAVSETPEPYIVTDESTGSFTADLTCGYEKLSSAFEISDGWSNGSMFNCTWRRSNCIFDDGKMTLMIDNDSAGSSTPYSGAEFRTKAFYGFGYYETTMKPIANDGVVSSFFTYTGPSDNNPWDEIDIEFLGKDTTKVQFNYFTDGVGENVNEHIHDLGFNAAEGFHTYGFDWQKDSITWYVDGKAVYKATENIPQTPGKIMMNTWPGKGVDKWLKKYDGTVPLKAEYTSVSYSSSGFTESSDNADTADTESSV